MALATSAMNLRQLTASFLTAAAATTAFGIAPAQAQFYGHGNGWRQPNHSRPAIRPTHSNMIYQPSAPVMRRPSFGGHQRPNNSPGFGHSSGSYFGW
jgi:hypothetical protein